VKSVVVVAVQDVVAIEHLQGCEMPFVGNVIEKSSLPEKHR